MSFAACRGLTLFVGNTVGEGLLDFSDGTIQSTAYPGTATEFTIPTLTVTETSNLGGTTNITGNVYQIIGDTKNTQYGYQALTNSSNGTLNTAIGYEAMAANSAGNYNTSVGDYSLATNSSGNYNTSIGHFSSIYNTTGSQNSSMGANSLQNCTTGSNNTCIGYDTGSAITTESNNTCIGYQSGVASGCSNSTSIGTGSTCTSSNQIMLGTSSQTVEIPGNLTTNGVFSISPSTTLDIGATNTTVSVPGSLTVGSANNGLTNNIYGTNNMIYGSNTNTFQASSNNFIATNNFTGPTIFNSGFKCGTQSTAYILYFGTATVVIGGTSETTTENTYSVCTLDSSFPTTVVGAVVSSGSQNFICDFMGPSSNPSTNQINVVFKNITNNAQGLPNSIFYMAWGY